MKGGSIRRASSQKNSYCYSRLFSERRVKLHMSIMFFFSLRHFAAQCLRSLNSGKCENEQVPATLFSRELLFRP